MPAVGFDWKAKVDTTRERAPGRLLPLEKYMPLRNKLRPYEVRLHAYMARDLPAKDEDGSIDPYLCVSFAGKRFLGHEGNAGDKYRTRVVWDSMHPQWFETMTLRTWLPITDPQNMLNSLKLLPDVVVEVWDSDLEASRSCRCHL